MNTHDRDQPLAATAAGNDMPMSASHLGRSLVFWRTLRRIKQAHAAELCGVSQATISRWERGTQSPSRAEARRLRSLMAARPDSAADQALKDLVLHSRRPVHLICDLTHALLAASSSRQREWRIGVDELIGASLWKYASAEIIEAERRLPDAGWFEPIPMSMRVVTRANTSCDVPIEPSRLRWTRMRLADGSFARLVETEGAA